MLPNVGSTTAAAPNDAELARRIIGRDEAAFEALMRRHNGRLFRVARAILRDDSEAEDALQEAYLDAYKHMASFRAGAQLGTWLTRIVINESLMRLRRHKRERVVIPFGERAGTAGEEPGMDVADTHAEPPPAAALRGEIRRLIERKLDQLPVAFRTVFVMREIEEMTVHETAECLSIPEATVRTRLFRARALLREALARDLDAATAGVFGFAGARCDRIVATVLGRVRAEADAVAPSGHA